MTKKNPLRRWRKSHDITQCELARILNVHRNTVIDWERGRYVPGTINMLKIYERTGITPSDWQRFLLEVK